jgi:uncharacterized membrane protein YdjX (TVP38/TMEM64 family)
MTEKAKGKRRNRSMNYLAIVVAAGAAFVASAVWYTVFGKAMMELSRAADTGASLWTMLFVIAQSLIIAFMVAYFVSRVGITDFASAAGLGALLWIFPAAILLGSVVHEGVPLALAAIHAGDWLVKLLLIGVVVGVWR